AAKTSTFWPTNSARPNSASSRPAGAYIFRVALPMSCSSDNGWTSTAGKSPNSRTSGFGTVTDFKLVHRIAPKPVLLAGIERGVVLSCNRVGQPGVNPDSTNSPRASVIAYGARLVE